MVNGGRFIQVLVLFLKLLCVGSNEIFSTRELNSSIRCLKGEQDALLKFKQGFEKPSGTILSSWVSEEDCCKWRGVVCSNITGHVISLDLRSSSSGETLQGDLSSSLADLHHLSYLDLSVNDFRQSHVPEFIGSFNGLKYLNLSSGNFRGTIPSNFGNLSRLEYLDMSDNDYSLRVENIDWIYGLSSLKVLDLSGVDLSSIGDDWLVAINRLPFLVKLSLFSCQLNKLPSSLPFVNFTSLEFLDLSFNSFYATIPQWLFNISKFLLHINISRSYLGGSIPDSLGNMTSLTVLDLSENFLSGSIPATIVDIISLRVLDLSRNSLTGGVPTTLGLIQGNKGFQRPSSLRELYLSHNQLNGSLAQSLPQLSQLYVLDVAFNSLNGFIDEAQLVNFSDLRVLDLSSNLFVFNVSSGWIPAFRLDTLGLRSCGLGPEFPKWLRTQKGLLSIDISNTNISDTVPDWFWNLSMNVEHMNLSFNNLRGNLPADFSLKLNLSEIDLSHNLFHGPLPSFSPNVMLLILSGNMLSGQLASLCKIIVPGNSLSYLDLSNNSLSGSLPDCWTHGKNLVVLNLAMNMLSETIPDSVGRLVVLKTLRLDRNNFTGVVPLPLKYCRRLFVLDLGFNMLSGDIPAWIGENLANLMLFRSSHNDFHGNIPLELCKLKGVVFLDLSFNKLSGTIPRCFNNFLTLALVDSVPAYIYDPYTTYKQNLLDTLINNTPKNFGNSGSVLMFIDLGWNALSGVIPGELTSLIGLQYLNLSTNHLTGSIPSNIGAMKNLEVLDLSRNRLSCSIPASAADLEYLAALNLSYNDLSGKIPSQDQFSTFSEDSYYGNQKLCGVPLRERCLLDAYKDPHCSNQQVEVGQNKNENHEESDVFFFIGVGIGFMTGSWVFWGSLLLKRSWRYAYFQFLEDVINKLYVITAINIAKLKRKLQNEQVT